MISTAVGAGFGSESINQVQSRERQVNLQKQQTPHCGQGRQRFPTRPPDSLLNGGGDKKQGERQKHTFVNQVQSREEENNRAHAGGAHHESQRLLLLPVEGNRQTAQEQQAGTPRRRRG